MFCDKFKGGINSRLLLAAIAFSIFGCGEKRTPIVFLLPEGYVGWTKTCYNLKGASKFEEENGYLVFKFDSTGANFTSLDLEEGWAKDQFFYYNGSSRKELPSTGWGGGGMIWGAYTENRDGNYCSGFFVGTEKQFKEHGIQTNHLPGDMKLTAD